MKKIWILGFCLLVASGLQAQTTYNSSGKSKYNKNNKKQREEGFAQRIIWGGELAVSLGDYTNLGISPVLGYRITDNFSAGIGMGYQYYRYKDFFTVHNNATQQDEYWDLKANFFSPSIWARYIVWRNLFVHAEGEYNFMSFKQPVIDGNTGGIISQTTRYQVPSVLIGPGYRLPMGEKASINFSLLYDVLQDEYSPHGNQPFVRIQFLAGF